MSTITRRRRTSRTNIGPYKRNELLCGFIQYTPSYSGYGDGVGSDLTKFISAEMRADWAANREVLIKLWQSNADMAAAFPDDYLPWLHSGGYVGPLPWACQHLD